MMTVLNKKQHSVLQQLMLLKQAVESPSEMPLEIRGALLPALQSQGALAAMGFTDLNIVSMSLNTHKSTADACVDGGYQALNEYRQAALERMKTIASQPEKAGRGTIEWYKSELSSKTDKLNTITNDMAEMAQRLDDTLALAHQMAKAAGQEDEFIRRRSEILRKFRV